MKLDVRSMSICSLFSILIAIGAFIKLPISIVPVTMQTLFVVLAGIVLGKRLAVVSVLLYIVIGLIGIPIFANGGGITYVLQPTFGYLIGFVFAAYIVGHFSEKSDSITMLIIVSIIAMIVIYLFGMVYFIWIQNVYYKIDFTWSWVLYYLFLVYLPGDLLSCIVASYVGKRVKNALESGNV